MKRLTFLLGLIFLTTGQHTFACTCDTEREFLTVAPKTEFVALVKVNKHLSFKDIYNKQTPMSMEVEIIEIYKGTESRKNVIVWGDNGILCRPYLSRFDIGEYYVIAFNKGTDGSKGYGHKDEKTSDYSISICGKYWLKADLKKQIAQGSVKAKQTQIKLRQIKKKLMAN